MSPRSKWAFPGPGGDIAVGEGSVWVTAFEFPLSRIDPSTNTVVLQFTGPGGDAVRVGLGSVWLSNIRAGNVWRLDPRRVEASLPEYERAVKAQPYSIRCRVQKIPRIPTE